VTSNVLSLPEVAGDAAVWSIPYDPRAIADGIYRVLTDERLRRDMVHKGRARAGQLVGAVGAAGARDLRRGRGVVSESRIALVRDWLTGMRGGEKVSRYCASGSPHAERTRWSTCAGRCRPPSSACGRTRRSCSESADGQAAGRHYLRRFPTAIEHSRSIGSTWW
jgi:hypothetical protein